MYGKRIKELRKKFNMTQRELAEKLNFKSASTVGMIEREERELNLETLSLISDIFSVSTDYIIGKCDSPNDNTNNTFKNKVYLDTIPKEFTNAEQARAYIDRHQIFGAHGFDPDRLDDSEIIEFANELLKQMEMVSFKYKK